MIKKFNLIYQICIVGSLTAAALTQPMTKTGGKNELTL